MKKDLSFGKPFSNRKNENLTDENGKINEITVSYNYHIYNTLQLLALLDGRVINL